MKNIWRWKINIKEYTSDDILTVKERIFQKYEKTQDTQDREKTIIK